MLLQDSFIPVSSLIEFEYMEIWNRYGDMEIWRYWIYGYMEYIMEDAYTGWRINNNNKTKLYTDLRMNKF